MPGDNPILRHWQVQRKVLHDNLSRLREKMDEDAIHDLRVAIKKLRSYVKLYGHLCHKKDADELTSIRKLFSVFGKHRNMSITRKLLTSFSETKAVNPNSLLIYLQLLQDQITPFCQQTLHDFNEVQLDDFTKRLNEHFQNTDQSELCVAVKGLIGSATKTVSRDLDHFKKKSHLIRKHLKDIFYWSHLFDEEIYFPKPELKRLDKILDHLGSVQDHEVLKENLKNFRKAILANSLTEYELVKKMEFKVKKKKDALLDKANTMAEELMANVQKSPGD